MNQAQHTSATQHQRRRYFIDRIVQGRLVISLILLELLIFGTAMWFVYTDLQHHIDTNLYRVHQVQLDSLPVLINSLMHIIPWIILVNVLAIIIVDKIWAGYVRKIVFELEKIFFDLKNLNIKQPVKINGEHEVITQAKNYLFNEYQRNQSIRELVDTLSVDLSTLDKSGRERLSESLDEIQRLLS
jgi:hypothetical protein